MSLLAKSIIQDACILRATHLICGLPKAAQHDQTVAVRRVVIEVKSTTDSKQDAKDINIVTTTSPSSDTIASYRQYDDTFILKDIESISKVSKSPKEEVEEVKEPPTGAGATAETIKKQLFGNRGTKKVENKLDISSDPLVNELRVMREMVASCPQIWTYMNGECDEFTFG